jgi:hypothetical protein
MVKPPFNPARLLSLLMTEQNALSFTGDLEEELQLSYRKHGRIPAVFAFCWQLLFSLPPLILSRMRYRESRKSLPAASPGWRFKLRVEHPFIRGQVGIDQLVLEVGKSAMITHDSLLVVSIPVMRWRIGCIVSIHREN